MLAPRGCGRAVPAAVLAAMRLGVLRGPPPGARALATAAPRGTTSRGRPGVDGASDKSRRSSGSRSGWREGGAGAGGRRAAVAASGGEAVRRASLHALASAAGAAAVQSVRAADPGAPLGSLGVEVPEATRLVPGAGERGSGREAPSGIFGGAEGRAEEGERGPSSFRVPPPWRPSAAPAWPEAFAGVCIPARGNADVGPVTVVAVDPDLSGAVAVLRWDGGDGGDAVRGERGGGAAEATWREEAIGEEVRGGGRSLGLGGAGGGGARAEGDGRREESLGRLASRAPAGGRLGEAEAVDPSYAGRRDGVELLEVEQRDGGGLSDAGRATVASSCVSSSAPPCSAALAGYSTLAARVSVFDLPTRSVPTSTRTRKRHDTPKLLEIFKGIVREHRRGEARGDEGAAACIAAPSSPAPSSSPPPLPPLAMLEAAVPSPLSGKHSWFSAGYSAGLFEGVLSSLDGFPPHAVGRVPAVVWKRDLGLWGGGKAASLELARQLFPQAAGMLERKRDHGRAEALLIAAWAAGCRRERAEAAGEEAGGLERAAGAEAGGLERAADDAQAASGVGAAPLGCAVTAGMMSSIDDVDVLSLLDDAKVSEEISSTEDDEDP